MSLTHSSSARAIAFVLFALPLRPANAEPLSSRGPLPAGVRIALVRDAPPDAPFVDLGPVFAKVSSHVSWKEFLQLEADRLGADGFIREGRELKTVYVKKGRPNFHEWGPAGSGDAYSGAPLRSPRPYHRSRSGPEPIAVSWIPLD